MTDAHIDSYPVQPRGRCRLASELRAVLERAHKSLLNDIVCVPPYVSHGQGMQPRTRIFVSPPQLIAGNLEIGHSSSRVAARIASRVAKIVRHTLLLQSQRKKFQKPARGRDSPDGFFVSFRIPGACPYRLPQDVLCDERSPVEQIAEREAPLKGCPTSDP